jgi:hypothetical protein
MTVKRERAYKVAKSWPGRNLTKGLKPKLPPPPPPQPEPQ